MDKLVAEYRGLLVGDETIENLDRALGLVERLLGGTLAWEAGEVEFHQAVGDLKGRGVFLKKMNIGLREVNAKEFQCAFRPIVIARSGAS